ncbi:hypothetical protein ACIBCN_28635 [Nocardia sp. NPDC051052]|uniref:hypothetical protein n=1 Tax=Nocardia sp. NPDC051052 TaxID=3364322 RepID=UPI0037BCE607
MNEGSAVAVTGARDSLVAGSVAEAEQEVQKYRELLSGDPQNKSYKSSLGLALTDLLTPRLAAAGRKSAAGLAAREGVEIQLQLAADPALAPTDVFAQAVRAVNAAEFLLTDTEAVTATQAATAVMRKLHTDYPEDLTFQNYLGSLLSEKLAAKLSDAADKDGATAAAREGIQIQLELATNPALAPGDVYAQTVRISSAAEFIPRDEAITATRSAAAILRKLSTDYPNELTFRSFLGSMFTERLAPKLTAAGDKDGAAAAAREGIQIELELAGNPALAPEDVLVQAIRLSYAADFIPGAEAITATRSAAAVLRKLCADHPEELRYQSFLAWVLSEKLAPKLSAAADVDGATVTAREGIQLHLQLAANRALPLSDVYINALRAVYALRYLPDDEAVTAARPAIEDLRRVAQTEPDNPALREALARALGVLAERLRAAGRVEEAADADVDTGWVREFGSGALYGTDYRFPLRTPTTVVSRNPLVLDVIVVGSDESVYTIQQDSHWLDYIRIGTINLPPRTPLAAVARDADHMDVWAVGRDGLVHGAWWDGQWHEWGPVRDKTFPVGTPLAAVSRVGAGVMELFGMDGDGAVFGVAWTGDWGNWYRIRTKTFPIGTPVAAVARSGVVDVFAVDGDGGVFLSIEAEEWTEWTRLGAKAFPRLTPIETLLLAPYEVAIFAIDGDGGVYEATMTFGELTQDWTRIGTRTFPVGSKVAATFLDLWPGVVALDANGVVYHAQKVDGHWQDWERVGAESDTLPTGTPITGIARRVSQFPYYADIFGIGADRGIHSIVWNGVWQRWFRIPVAVIRFSEPIESGGIAALGGFAGVNISRDGAVQWYGHAHDSGADGYDFGVAFFIRTTLGDPQVLAFSHNGSVNPSGRDHDWEVIYPRTAVVQSSLPAWATARHAMDMQYTSHIGETFEGLVSMAVKWAVGAAGGIVVGAVVFAGVEIGSLIATGSLVPGACVLEEILWMAGPGNTLLAIAAAAIVELGSRHRELTPEEYSWANDSVFGGTLPPRDKIRLTDVLGPDDRPFTLPMWDGKISLNMGSEGYDDPRKVGLGRQNVRQNRAKARGETFIHELVHAWQIHHTGFDLAILGRALAAKLDEVGGGDPYDYAAAGLDYLAYSIEGQAQIVSDWFGNHVQFDATGRPTGLDSAAALNDTYFRYIANNIRTGYYLPG